jgi:hypothetical protein
MKRTLLPLLLGLALASSSFAGPPPKPAAAITMASGAPLQVVPGGGALPVEADDQDANRLTPGLFTWAIPAGANFGVQETAAGWLLSAPVGAVPGTWQVLVQYKPDPTLSPTATVTIGKSITAIKIVVAPQ